MITIQNLTKTYSSGQHVVKAIDHVTLTVETGEIFGIIGLSGAGKSSLLRCINMLEHPTSGDIHIGDKHMNTLKGDALRMARRKIGMIFQDFNLLSNKTVFENVALPLKLQHLKPDEISKRVESILSFVDLSDKANAYPSQLSGGQKQRVGIARALVTEPEVLLCDEATSALDPITTRQILALLKKLNQALGITVVLITHEMQVVQTICDHVAFMEQGKVLAFGQTEKVLNDPSLKRFLGHDHNEEEAVNL